jgi:hypothetical protein
MHRLAARYAVFYDIESALEPKMPSEQPLRIEAAERSGRSLPVLDVEGSVDNAWSVICKQIRQNVRGRPLAMRIYCPIMRCKLAEPSNFANTVINQPPAATPTNQRIMIKYLTSAALIFTMAIGSQAATQLIITADVISSDLTSYYAVGSTYTFTLTLSDAAVQTDYNDGYYYGWYANVGSGYPTSVYSGISESNFGGAVGTTADFNAGLLIYHTGAVELNVIALPTDSSGISMGSYRLYGFDFWLDAVSGFDESISGTTVPTMAEYFSTRYGTYIVTQSGDNFSLSFRDATNNEYNVYFNPTSFTVVPEPSEYAGIAGLGVLAAAVLVRRRRA